MALLSLAAAPSAQSQNAENPTPVEVRNGTASFDVDTNMPALHVHGKSTALEAHVRVRSSPDGPLLEQIDAAVPVKTLLTGIVLRDEHMRKYIFTKSDGQMPDVRFVAGSAACAKVSANESMCRLAGDLVIRDMARPFAMDLKVTEDGGSFHASGDGIVSLSAYGIERPSQLGVTTADEVRLRLNFTARPGPVATVSVTR